MGTAVLAAGFVGVAALVRIGPPPVDGLVARVLIAFGDGPAGSILTLANTLGEATVVWGGVALLTAALAARGRGREALGCGVCVAAAEVAVLLVKLLLSQDQGVPSLASIAQGGFPSGHVTRVIVLAGLLVNLTDDRRGFRAFAVVLAAAVGVLVAAARIVVDAHSFSDVTGATLLGLLVLCVAALSGVIVIPAARDRPSARVLSSRTGGV